MFTIQSVNQALRDGGFDYEICAVNNWCDEVAKQVFSNNTLRANKIFSGVFIWVDYFADKYSLAGLGEDPIGKKLIYLSKKLPEEVRDTEVYSKLELKDKLRINGELSNIALEFLQIFEAEPKSKQTAA